MQINFYFRQHSKNYRYRLRFLLPVVFRVTYFWVVQKRVTLEYTKLGCQLSF